MLILQLKKWVIRLVLIRSWRQEFIILLNIDKKGFSLQIDFHTKDQLNQIFRTFRSSRMLAHRLSDKYEFKGGQ